jgi:hypothetical protein
MPRRLLKNDHFGLSFGYTEGNIFLLWGDTHMKYHCDLTEICGRIRVGPGTSLKFIGPQVSSIRAPPNPIRSRATRPTTNYKNES